MTGSSRELEINRLGSKGDGVADGIADGIRDAPDRLVYVPFSLPGELVRAEVINGRGRLEAVLRPSADRASPACRHFGSCGGCALQHLKREAYLEWKRQIVAGALAARGIDAGAMIEPVREIGQACRRRAVFAARRTKKTVLIGFHAARDSELVEITECPVMHPHIISALPGLKRLAAPLLTRRGEARILVTRAENGLDVSITGGRPDIGPDLLAELARMAADLNLARLTVDGEPVAIREKPVVTFSGVDVAVPPGGFLQASPDADLIMAQIVCAAAGGAAHVADLFAGVGTLTFPLAAKARVFAVDSNKEAISALLDGARHASGLKPIGARVRDLFVEPLASKELEGFDAVVFDPPRAGAKAQAAALAASKVPTVIAVSCNPATLARDARILIDGGYKLERITPIDQFLYSPHVEAVAVLRR